MSGATDIELLDLRALRSVHDRHDKAVATGCARTGAATIAFYLAMSGAVILPPGVSLTAAGLDELEGLAQDAELRRLQQPAARGSWHAEGRA